MEGCGPFLFLSVFGILYLQCNSALQALISLEQDESLIAGVFNGRYTSTSSFCSRKQMMICRERNFPDGEFVTQLFSHQLHNIQLESTRLDLDDMQCHMVY